jgi:hypothetical protein
MAVVAAVLAVIVVVVVVVLASGSSGSQPGPRSVESIFQDDNLLVYSPTPTVSGVMRILRSLGVDRIRVSVLWLAIAPKPSSKNRPNFDAANPADYPTGAWAPYDRLAQLASADGIKLDFDVTAPGPLWAMKPGAPQAKLATHWYPSASEYGKFVTAVGRRYSGQTHTSDGKLIPRVSFWTMWNEPNQPGWLAPQWRSAGGAPALTSAALYRSYIDAGYAGLRTSGHTTATDTILVGELAPEGTESHQTTSAAPPLPFLRALYCVDASDRPLRGQPAQAVNCPASGSPSAFASAHPGLFEVTGFAHHPYSFFLPPSSSMSDRNFVPLSDLSRLETSLDGIFSTYGVHRQLPLYLTEYGYETNPPNPFRGVSPAKQALYLDEAQYMAWKNPRVRAMAQFLLVDSAPDHRYPPGTIGYWSTFQTGLLYLGFKPKPSFTSYPMPIWIPQPSFHSGGSVLVWGMLRVAANGTKQRAKIQWQGSGGTYRTVDTVTTSDPSGFLTANVNLPGSGRVRIEWTSPQGKVMHSRAAAVTQT